MPSVQSFAYRISEKESYQCEHENKSSLISFNYGRYFLLFIEVFKPALTFGILAVMYNQHKWKPFEGKHIISYQRNADKIKIAFFGEGEHFIFEQKENTSENTFLEGKNIFLQQGGEGSEE